MGNHAARLTGGDYVTWEDYCKLLKENAELVEALERIDGVVYDSWTNGATAGEIAHAALAKHRGE